MGKPGERNLSTDLSTDLSTVCYRLTFPILPLGLPGLPWL